VELMEVCFGVTDSRVRDFVDFSDFIPRPHGNRGKDHLKYWHHFSVILCGLGMKLGLPSL